ncbi:hypothetical protein [Lentibacillus populi]|uniref:hypothetical protein n=1 Tax=Lentibacillus populi TaxID=1827502 RepID=UPI0016630201|nr:hypothetical protein [Lentibacillus populi]
METVLFFGVLGAVSAFCLFVLTQKLAYFVVGMDSLVFLIISLVVYLCVIFYFIFYYKEKITNLKRVKQNTKKRASWSLLYTSPAIGYITYHSFIKESQFLHHAMIFVFFMLGIFFIYISVKFLHKYYFIRTNIDLVVFQEPSTKEKKKALAKGKEIIIK